MPDLLNTLADNSGEQLRRRGEQLVWMAIPGGEAVSESTRGTWKDPYSWTSN